MWDTEGPGLGLNGSASCSQSNQAGCVYQDEVFVQRVSQIIANHSKAPAAPLFLFWAPHAPHDPYQVPQSYLDKFANISVPERQYYAAMTNLLDDNVGRVVEMFKDAGLWENTLMVLSSDNGGPEGSGYGGNNVRCGRLGSAVAVAARARAPPSLRLALIAPHPTPAVPSLRREGQQLGGRRAGKRFRIGRPHPSGAPRRRRGRPRRDRRLVYDFLRARGSCGGRSRGEEGGPARGRRPGHVAAHLGRRANEPAPLHLAWRERRLGQGRQRNYHGRCARGRLQASRGQDRQRCVRLRCCCCCC